MEIRGGGGDKCWAETPPNTSVFTAPPCSPITPASTRFKKHYIIYLSQYTTTSLILVCQVCQIYGLSIYPCFAISSLFRAFSLSLSAAKTKSALYTSHHNNHKCSDRFAATALRGVVHARKRNKEREKKVKWCHPPTHIRNNKCTFCSLVIENTPLATSSLAFPSSLLILPLICSTLHSRRLKYLGHYIHALYGH